MNISKGTIWEHPGGTVEWMHDMNPWAPITCECMKVNGEYPKRGEPYSETLLACFKPNKGGSLSWVLADDVKVTT